MKPLHLISLALILLLLTAGCLDDLSSTLPPCCDGTCDGVKTSVIEKAPADLAASKYTWYVIDSEGIMYGWNDGVIFDYVTPYYGHNVTFSYEMVNGHRHITGIIEDHDAKSVCNCAKYIIKDVGGFKLLDSNESTYSIGSGYISINGSDYIPVNIYHEKTTSDKNNKLEWEHCQCVQKYCGCEGK